MKKRKFIITLIVSAIIIAVLYTSITTLAKQLRPYVFSCTILGTTQNDDGTYSPYVYKTDGIYKYIGATIDFILGGNPFDDSIVTSVSANFIADVEKPAIIKQSDTLPRPSDDAAVRTINPSGGGILLNDKISINNETKYTLDAVLFFAPSQNATLLVSVYCPYAVGTTQSLKSLEYRLSN